MSDDQTDHDLRLSWLVEEIRRKRSRVVGFQMPDGLKRYVPCIRKRIEGETDALPIFCTEPCFGGCDLSRSLPDLGCDLIVHMGHSRMVGDGRVPVVYVPCFSRTSSVEALKSRIAQIPVSNIGLVSSLQHCHELGGIASLLRGKGCQVYVGNPSPRTECKGQVLGCDFKAARDIMDKVESFLYVGGGNFHPLGVALATKREVRVIDPYSQEYREVDRLRDTTLRKRFAQIERAREARDIGLLVSTKPGQIRVSEALNCRQALRSAGFDAVMLSSDHLDPSRLVLYDLDAYVNFGCPRMAVEDCSLFPRPVLTPPEVEILLGTTSWEDYRPDEIEEEKS